MGPLAGRLTLLPQNSKIFELLILLSEVLCFLLLLINIQLERMNIVPEELQLIRFEFCGAFFRKLS